MFMHTSLPQELHSHACTGSQAILPGRARGHKKWLLAWERWEARQELPSLLAWLALKEGKGHALLA